MPATRSICFKVNPLVGGAATFCTITARRSSTHSSPSQSPAQQRFLLQGSYTVRQGDGEGATASGYGYFPAKHAAQSGVEQGWWNRLISAMPSSSTGSTNFPFGPGRAIFQPHNPIAKKTIEGWETFGRGPAAIRHPADSGRIGPPSTRTPAAWFCTTLRCPSFNR